MHSHITVGAIAESRSRRSHTDQKPMALQRIVFMPFAQFLVKTLKTQFIHIKTEVYHHATTLTVTVNQSRVLRCR